MFHKKTIHPLLFIFILSFFATNISNAQQCQATTKKGTQCTRKAQTGSNYCFQHRAINESASSKHKPDVDDLDSSKVVKKQSSQPGSDQSYSGQCQAKTKKGDPCSRRAKSGSKYCWQHSK